jgi:hypothetical protein
VYSPAERRSAELVTSLLPLMSIQKNTANADVGPQSASDRKRIVQILDTMSDALERLEAEGYGAQHPVSTNDTHEGRHRNRRIDVRVTSR